MNLDFNQICRLCLRLGDNHVDLRQANGVKSLSEEITQKIGFCYFLRIDLSDGLPTKVCHECIQVISFFYIAKKNAIISEKLLRDVFYVRQKKEDNSDIHQRIEISGCNIYNAESKNLNPSRSLYYQPLKIDDIGINYVNECESNNPSNMGSRRDKSVGKMLKKLPNLPDEKLNTCKVNTIEKKAHKTHLPLEENDYKEIGTVIDTSNILSPSAKRKRKSVLER